MDFVNVLPESESYDEIMVIVDRLTKIRYFLPATPPSTRRTLLGYTCEIYGNSKGYPHMPTPIMSRNLQPNSGTLSVNISISKQQYPPPSN